jgi:hypothetical protein
MLLRCALWAGLVLLADLGAAGAGTLFPFRKQEPARQEIPLELLSERQRDLAKQVLEKPAFTAKGPSESFFCRPEHYQFFLDHPDRAVTAWRRLGAKCVTIANRGAQQFGWCDDQGSEVTWETIHRGAELHIWYAEGKVRPGPLMPLVPVKALLVMRHKELQARDGASRVQHQAELYVQTDSKTASALTRMLGPATARMAEQGMGQIQLFFSGISRYLDGHPDQVETLLEEEK